MNLHEFEAAVKAINFQDPSVSQNWENFQDRPNAFTADCQPIDPEKRLKPKMYQAVLWKSTAEIRYNRIPQRGIGRIVERYPLTVA
jgi:hypothetical protein